MSRDAADGRRRRWQRRGGGRGGAAAARYWGGKADSKASGGVRLYTAPQKLLPGSRAEAGREEVFAFHTFCAAAPSRLTELKRGVLGGDASAASRASPLGGASLAGSPRAICSMRSSRGVSPSQ